MNTIFTERKMVNTKKNPENTLLPSESSAGEDAWERHFINFGRWKREKGFNMSSVSMPQTKRAI